MNLVLLFDEDFINEKQAHIQGRRFQHICHVHRANVGDQLRVGLLNCQIGTGTITSMEEEYLTMDVVLKTPPPKALPTTLILALPRPKMLKRILQTCATMGVKEIILINSYNVEKSYWQTPQLTPEAIKDQLILGLEQGKDTVMPTVTQEKRFKPFVEDTLPSLCQPTQTFIAHPGQHPPCPTTLNHPANWIVGPEGGFIPYEIEKLKAAGGTCISLGQRILRTETAIPVLLSKFPT